MPTGTSGGGSRRAFPKLGVDVTEKTIPQEAFLERSAVSFTKGCFLGQELVCRIDTRGHVNKYLRRLDVVGADRPEVGAEIRFGGDVVGTVTSVTPPDGGPVVALGYVRREVEVPAEVSIGGSDAGSARHGARRRRSARDCRRLRQREPHGEGRAAIGVARRPDLAAHGRDQFAHDREAESRPDRPTRGPASRVEPFEDCVELVRGRCRARRRGPRAPVRRRRRRRSRWPPRRTSTRSRRGWRRSGRAVRDRCGRGAASGASRWSEIPSSSACGRKASSASRIVVDGVERPRRSENSRASRRASWRRSATSRSSRRDSSCDHGGGASAGVGVVDGAVGHRLGVPADRGEWGPEVVRDAEQERAFLAPGVVELLGHAVERGGELTELVGRMVRPRSTRAVRSPAAIRPAVVPMTASGLVNRRASRYETIAPAMAANIAVTDEERARPPLQPTLDGCW